MECDAFHVSYLSNKIPEAVFHSQAVKTVAYLRVSTALLDVRSERLAILEYAHKHDFRIDDFIEATASGQASEERRQLDELMHVLQRGDRLVVSELSRPARSLGRMGRMPALSGWRWHHDEVFVTISGERHYLWRAVDQEGKVLEAFVSKTRDRKAALRFLGKLMKRYPKPDAIITDRLRSYRAALRELGGSGPASSWLLAEQSCGEFTTAVPATRTRNAPYSGGCAASRNSPPSILPSTTTSTCNDPSAHGTISSSSAPLRSSSGVSSGRPNSLSSVE